MSKNDLRIAEHATEVARQARDIARKERDEAREEVARLRAELEGVEERDVSLRVFRQLTQENEKLREEIGHLYRENGRLVKEKERNEA